MRRHAPQQESAPRHGKPNRCDRRRETNRCDPGCGVRRACSENGSRTPIPIPSLLTELPRRRWCIATCAAGSELPAIVVMSFESTVMSGQFARRERAFRVFLERRIRIVRGVRLQRLHAAHALVRVEDFAVLPPAAHRRVVRRDRVDIFHRGIRPIRHHRARLLQLLPDVGALFGAPRAEAREHVWRVRRAVDSLHRGDHAQLPESRDVGGAEVLGVLDAPA